MTSSSPKTFPEILGQTLFLGARAGLWAGTAIGAAVVGANPGLRAVASFALIWSALIAGAIILIVLSARIVSRVARRLGPVSIHEGSRIRLVSFLFHLVIMILAAALAMGTGLSLTWAADGLRESTSPDLLTAGRVLLLAIVLGISGGFLYATYHIAGPPPLLIERIATRNTIRVGGLLLLYSAVLGLAMGSPLGRSTGTVSMMRLSARSGDLESVAALLGSITLGTMAIGLVIALLVGLQMGFLGSRKRQDASTRPGLAVALTVGIVLFVGLLVAWRSEASTEGWEADVTVIALLGALLTPLIDHLLHRASRRAWIAFVRYPLMILVVVGLGALSYSGPRNREMEPRAEWTPALVPAPVGGLKAMVLGFGGLSWNVLSPMMRRGELPALERHVACGISAPMESLTDLRSPEAWNTMATGHPPMRHGVQGFQRYLIPGTRRVLERFPSILKLYTPLKIFPSIPIGSPSRRVPALWDIASAADLRSAVIGHWASWPVDPIRGAMISDRFVYSRIHLDGSDARDEMGQASPEELLPKLAPYILDPREVKHEDFGDFLHAGLLPVLEEKEPAEPILGLRMAYSNTETYRRVGARLLRRKGYFDLFWIYLQGIDLVSRYFWRWLEPEHFENVKQEDLRLFQDVIPGMYRYHDVIVDQFTELTDSQTVLLIASDHGFGPASGSGPGHETFLEQPTRSGARRHRAVLIASGPEVVRGARLHYCSLYDMAPTVLGVLGLPAASDMPGQTLPVVSSGRYSVSTYGRFSHRRGRTPPPTYLDHEMEASLRVLGHLH